MNLVKCVLRRERERDAEASGIEKIETFKIESEKTLPIE